MTWSRRFLGLKLEWLSQSPDMKATDHAFHLLKARWKPLKQEEVKMYPGVWSRLGVAESGNHWLRGIWCNFLSRLKLECNMICSTALRLSASVLWILCPSLFSHYDPPFKERHYWSIGSIEMKMNFWWWLPSLYINAHTFAFLTTICMIWFIFFHFRNVFYITDYWNL